MEDTSSAIIGLVGVLVGALVSLIGTVVVPWVRDSIDRRRDAAERATTERRDSLLAAMSALLDMRQLQQGSAERARAQTRFGTSLNELTVRLTPADEPVRQGLLLMLSMVLDAKGTNAEADRTAEVMEVLTLWARGDLASGQVAQEIERRARVKFSEDGRTATPVPA